MQKNIQQGLPALAGLTENYDVFTHTDVNCYIPSVESLPELTPQNPHATWILNLRVVDKWIASLRAWDTGRVYRNYVNCDIKTEGFGSGVGGTDEELRQRWKTHVRRVREFVAAHPSLNYFELHIDSPNAGQRLQKRTGIDASCRVDVNSELPSAY